MVEAFWVVVVVMGVVCGLLGDGSDLLGDCVFCSLFTY